MSSKNIKEDFQDFSFNHTEYIYTYGTRKDGSIVGENGYHVPLENNWHLFYYGALVYNSTYQARTSDLFWTDGWSDSIFASNSNPIRVESEEGNYTNKRLRLGVSQRGYTNSPAYWNTVGTDKDLYNGAVL